MWSGLMPRLDESADRTAAVFDSADRTLQRSNFWLGTLQSTLAGRLQWIEVHQRWEDLTNVYWIVDMSGTLWIWP